MYEFTFNKQSLHSILYNQEICISKVVANQALSVIYVFWEIFQENNIDYLKTVGSEENEYIKNRSLFAKNKEEN